MSGSQASRSHPSNMNRVAIESIESCFLGGMSLRPRLATGNRVETGTDDQAGPQAALGSFCAGPGTRSVSQRDVNGKNTITASSGAFARQRHEPATSPMQDAQGVFTVTSSPRDSRVEERDINSTVCFPWTAAPTESSTGESCGSSGEYTPHIPSRTIVPPRVRMAAAHGCEPRSLPTRTDLPTSSASRRAMPVLFACHRALVDFMVVVEQRVLRRLPRRTRRYQPRAPTFGSSGLQNPRDAAGAAIHRDTRRTAAPALATSESARETLRGPQSLSSFLSYPYMVERDCDGRTQSCVTKIISPCPKLIPGRILREKQSTGPISLCDG